MENSLNFSTKIVEIELNWDIFNDFQELRFQIDEHRERERLKVRIDEIALAMIDKTKKYE